MGSQTFSEMQSSLKFDLGQRTDLDDYLDDWINIAYTTLTTQNKFFGKKYRSLYFPELETTSDKTTTTENPYIDVPSDCLFVRYVWDVTNDVKLKNMSFRDYVSQTGREDTDSQSTPTEWVRYGSYIYLHPSPDAIYTIRVYYRKRVAALSSGTGTTAIGQEWDEVIVKLAAAQSHLRLKEYDEAEQKKSEFKDMMDALCGIYGNEKMDMTEYFHLDPSYNQFGY